MSRHRPGKTRIKLAKLLSEALPDVDIQPEDLTEAKGWYRNDFRADCYRWECDARLRDLPGVNVCFGSYSTMTSCVRYGISVSDKRTRFGLREIRVESKESSHSAKASNV